MFHVLGCNKNVILEQQEVHVAFHWQSLEALNDTDLRPGILRSFIPQWLKLPAQDIFVSIIKNNT